MSLSKTHLSLLKLVQLGKIQTNITEKIVDWDVKNNIKKKSSIMFISVMIVYLQKAQRTTNNKINNELIWCPVFFSRWVDLGERTKLTPGRVAQSVTCLATDACLTAIPGVVSSIPARSHTFVEIDHEIISTVILLPSADSFKKGCCQLQAKVCARITGYPLIQACPGKSVVR